jgi:ATP-dependent Clp protease ATP-binding subunit ClpC
VGTIVGILIGLIAGLLIATARQRWQAAAPAAQGPCAQAPRASDPPTSDPQAAAEPFTLTARLNRLEGTFASYSANYAHPRELEDQAGFAEAVTLLADPQVALDIVGQYALGSNWALSCAALAALRQRPDGAQLAQTISRNFDKLHLWAMFFALKYLAELDERPPVGEPLAGAQEWWAENLLLTSSFRDYFAARAANHDSATFGGSLQQTPAASAAAIKAFLERVHHPLATALIGQLESHKRSNIDRGFLASFGRFWSEKKDHEALLEREEWREPLSLAEAGAQLTPVRSLLVSGEPRVGKTSFLLLLARRLERDGWTIFEAGGADLMAGQQWFGQLEGRIQRTIEEAAASKKLIWYIPDILHLARSGTHQGQAASILDQILPAIQAGRLLVWTEASPKSMAHLLQFRPALRGLLEVVRLEPQTPAQTTVLAQRVADRIGAKLGFEMQAGAIETALSSARQYLSSYQLPGSVIDLIRLTANRASRGTSSKIEAGDVIVTLSQLTGLPISILDHHERMDLDQIRAYFRARVIGQDEAVSAIVERIAMLKAGLSDPSKPIGVFLFAGATGTGKTELAKTTADYLFGSIDRLIRLDMSEFQTAAATSKIIGEAGASSETDCLIARVRKQPFSVVLLDEFEKAHANIWDLFLQVFDDGRLTDALGQVADFRHCIIVLTSNLGASGQQGSGLGFAPPTANFASEQVLRAIAQTFRPEFQNRLDKVIVFQPLTRDLMREILKKELDLLLDRRGLKDREWAVEWEASAQEFLLEKGFSASMGARPLKRAIDQYLIAPLAATIVERRFPEGDQFVFVRSDGRAIQAEFVDPDSAGDLDGAEPGEGTPGLLAIVLKPTGSATELSTLAAEFQSLEQSLASTEWENLRLSLIEAMSAADFWKQADRHATLARLALIDRVEAANKTAAALRSRLRRTSERTGKASRELAGRLALQIHLLKEGIKDALEDAPIEIALRVEAVFEKAGDPQATRAWCRQLCDMYRGWARRRHMQLGELGGRSERHPSLIISGFGAHRLLAQEVGLHLFEGDEEKGARRATARVLLAVTPLGDMAPDRQHRLLMQAFEQSPRTGSIVRRYRHGASPLVRNLNGAWRTGRLDAVLRGDFDLIAASQA